MTQRVKGFPQPIIETSKISDLHVADLSRMAGAVMLGSTVEGPHLDAVQAGIPVVHESMYPLIQYAHAASADPDKIVDSARSAHSVGFGEIRSRNGGLMNVALKPFNSAELAINEARGYLWLAQKATATFMPVGIFPAKHGDHVISVTKMRHDLMSLDRDEWVHSGHITNAHEAEVAERNKRTVVDIASEMGRIHSQGGFLPDAQIKNWAVNPAGKIGAIDTENFMDLPPNHIDVVERAWSDIDKLVKSLVIDSHEGGTKIYGVGMFTGLPLKQLRASLEDTVFKPYIGALEKSFETATTEEELMHCMALTEGVMTRFYSDAEWPAHFMVQHQHQSSRSKVK